MKDNKLERRFVCGGMIAVVSAEIGSGLSTVTFEGAKTLSVPVGRINSFRRFTHDITESTEMLAWMSKLLPAMTATFTDEGSLSHGSTVPVGLVRPAAIELQKLGLVESQELPNTFLWRQKQ